MKVDLRDTRRTHRFANHRLFRARQLYFNLFWKDILRTVRGKKGFEAFCDRVRDAGLYSPFTDDGTIERSTLNKLYYRIHGAHRWDNFDAFMDFTMSIRDGKVNLREVTKTEKQTRIAMKG
jgi:hypothetical protein